MSLKLLTRQKTKIYVERESQIISMGMSRALEACHQHVYSAKVDLQLFPAEYSTTMYNAS